MCEHRDDVIRDARRDELRARTVSVFLSRDGIWLNGRPATAEEVEAALAKTEREGTR